MAKKRLASRRSLLQQSSKSRQLARQRRSPRRLNLESLEDRRVMAGLNLAALIPNSGVVLNTGDTLNVAPRELTFRFAQGQAIDPTTVTGGVIITRSGGDNSFGPLSPSPDITVTPGFIGLSTDTPREIIMRFASNLPDDLYRIQIIGATPIQPTDPLPLKDTAGVPFNNGVNQIIDFRLDLGTKVTAVVPQPIRRNGVLTQSRNSIEVYFDQNQLATGARTLPGFYRLIDTATANTATPSIMIPQSVSYDATQMKATLQFAADIPAGTFKLEVGATYESDGTTAQARHVGNSMTGPIQAFIGDTVTAGAAANSDVDLYRFDLRADVTDFNVTVTPGASIATGASLDAAIRLYKLDNGSLTEVTPPSPVNAETAGQAESIGGLSLAAGTYFVGVTSAGTVFNPSTGVVTTPGTSNGAYSILVTFNDAPAVNDANSSFATATQVGTLGLAGRTIVADIAPQLYTIQFPGAGDAPGERNTPFQEHITTVPGRLPDPTIGVETFTYDFQSIYGFTPQGQQFFNAITEPQKQRAREALELYSRYLGVQFREVSSTDVNVQADFTIATGDPRAVAPTVSTGVAPNGVNGIAGIQNLPNNSIAAGLLTSKAGAITNVNSSLTFPGIPQQFPISPIVVTSAAHGLTTGTRVAISGVGGNTAANGTWVITKIDDDRFSLNGSTTNGVYTSGGTWTVLDLAKGVAIMNGLVNWGSSEYGGTYFQTAMHEIGHLLGLGDNFEAPALAIMGGGETPTLAANAATAEPVFPGDPDIVYGQTLHRPESRDIDLYQFTVTAPGLFRAETIAERLLNSSLLNTVLTLYKEVTVPGQPVRREIVARNDDYYGNDSYLEVRLVPETSPAGATTKYYVAVTSVGNTEFDPTIADSGFGGRTQGNYSLTMNFKPDGGTSLTDTTGVKFDGDADGVPGGQYEFWFQSNTVANTIYVDKTSTANQNPAQNPNLGQLGSAYNNLGAALSAAAQPGVRKIVRVIGNGGTDGNVNTLGDNRPYLVGFKDLDPILDQPLADGGQFLVPQNVTVMIDAGANFKVRKANFNAGTTPQGLLARDGGAIQVLGTPLSQVQFTSYSDDTIGGDSDGPSAGPQGGDWGGIVFRDDSDREGAGVFLNYVNNAVLNYGGGKVLVDSVEEVYTPIHMATARPSLSYNTIKHSADAAMSADPNSFDDDGLRPNIAFDNRRIGPDIHDNKVGFLTASDNNSINGLFVRIRTVAGNPLDFVDVPTRWDDFDIVHVVSENLHISGTPGGAASPGSDRAATTLTDGRLRIDPGMIVKLAGARMETQISSQFIAEGTAEYPIVFTSLKDDKYGAGGTFDTGRDGTTTSPVPGDWGGLIFGAASSANLAQTRVFYGGGIVPVEGGFDSFNAIEIHQADARIANSVFQFNAAGGSTTNRNGRGTNADAAIFIRGAQPIIFGNIIRDNFGPMISVNANALVDTIVGDPGQATGPLNAISNAGGNHGPLVRGNRMTNNAVNGMEVRGGTLTTETVWDDTDIAYILRSEIVVPNHQVNSGIRLQSSQTESLVVKLSGITAGITAAGTPLDISDRIGGTVHIIGQPGHPVIMTSIGDDTVPAGFDPEGLPVFDTDNGSGKRFAGPEVNNGILIDDDILTGSVGHFEIQPGAGSSVGAGVANSKSGATAQGKSLLFTNQDFIFQFLNYIETGAGVRELSATTITTPPTLISPDHVRSAGNFINAAGAQVNWQVDTVMANGSPVATNTITFSSLQAFGNMRFVSYYDQADIVPASPNNDLLYQIGTRSVIPPTIPPAPPGPPTLPGADFRLATLSNSQRVGISLGGVYTQGPGLLNATYNGFAADTAPNLQGAVTGGANIYQLPGNINLATLPVINDPALGQVNGLNNVATAMAWTVDPTATSATITTFVELIPQNVVSKGSPGDWRGIKLDQFSNDRNVAQVLDAEPAYIATIGDNNNTPQVAQFLGSLANNQKNGDDTLRLGFEIDATIALDNPADVDVYSFTANSGTEVWIDLDRTSFGLDAMVELVDSDGNVLARATDTNPDVTDIFGSNPDAAGLTSFLSPTQSPSSTPVSLSFNKDPFRGRDTFTTNPHDATMRVVLPKAANGSNLVNVPFFVRVRSQPLNNDFTGENGNTLNPGLTSGHYQLQIRTQQQDEKAGSTVKFADLRFATNAIEVHGLPYHSPLAGETVEADNATNDTFAGAQNLGNLLKSDQNNISVGGQISSFGDVDWYQFDLNFDLLQVINGYTNAAKTWSTLFDLDYGDGFSRANATISVFDQTGRLIFVGRDSDVQDDQGTDALDLAKGTLGKLDPLVGPVQLPTGYVPRPGQATGSRTYFVAVTNDRQLPEVLDQTFNPTATDTNVRLEPIDSIYRTVTDHFDSQVIGGVPTGMETGEFAENAFISPLTGTPKSTLIDPSNLQSLQANVRPFTLADVPLFMVSGNKLFTINAATGLPEIINYANQVSGNLVPTSDIGFRGDGVLFGYESVFTPGTQNTAGALATIDTASGAAGAGANDGIPDLANPPPPPNTANFEEFITTNEVGALAWGGTPINGIQNTTLFYAVTERNALIVPATPGNNGPDGLPGTPDDVPAQPAVFGDTSRLYRANPTSGSAAVVQGQPWGRIGFTGDYLNLPVNASGSTTFQIPGAPITATFTSARAGLAGNGTIVRFQTPQQLGFGNPPLVSFTPGSTTPPVAPTVDITLNTDASFAKGFTDFNTNFSPTPPPGTGGRLDFTAVTPGSPGNNILITFAKTDLQQNGFPLVQVNGNTINITLDTDATNGGANATTIDLLVSAIQSDFFVSSLITVAPQGITSTRIGNPALGAIAPVQLGGGSDSGTSLQELVTTVNSVASSVVTASFTGNGNTGLAQLVPSPYPFQIVLDGGANSVGVTTGLAFGGGNALAVVNPGSGDDTLYGVTDQGKFLIDINEGIGGAPLPNPIPPGFVPPRPAAPTRAVAVTLPNPANPSVPIIPQFSGLTRGPQNLENGRYANMFFASTTDGLLVCLNANGVPQTVFDTNGDGLVDSSYIQTFAFGSTGLAFSPFDFNLWHPTYQRQNDPGHEINAAPDNMNRNGNYTSNPQDPGSFNHGLGRTNNVNLSFRFGFEQFNNIPGYTTSSYQTYLLPTGAGGVFNTIGETGNANLQTNGGQLGVISSTTHRELSTNPDFNDNYNMPGGAYGSLLTDKFSLATSKPTDKPTFYFDYFLETEDSNHSHPEPALVRDSARVFIGVPLANGTIRWDLLATNNSVLDNPNTGEIEGEIPTFLSASTTAHPDNARQQVQLLHDNTDVWRQARVDLSRYAGLTNLQLRFDFSTAGAMPGFDPTQYEDEFGNLNHRERAGFNPNGNVGLNTFQGFFVDNFTIGLAERGEMVTNAPVNTDFFTTPTPLNKNPSVPVPSQVLTGPYQLEVRRSAEYALSSGGTRNDFTPLTSFDSNERLIPDKRLTAPIPVEDFETQNFTKLPWSFAEDANWTITDLTTVGGTTFGAASGPIVNGESSGLTITLVTGAGNLTFDRAVSSRSGDVLRLYIDGLLARDANGVPTQWSGNNGDLPFSTITVPVAAGMHSFRWTYDKDGTDASGTGGQDRAYLDNISFPTPQIGVQDLYDDPQENDPNGVFNPNPRLFPLPPTSAPPSSQPQISFVDVLRRGLGRIGDENEERAQGHVQIEQNFVYAASQVGILIDAALRDPVTGNPYASVRNLPTLNNERLIPGVTVANNVVANSGQVGIQYSGDANPANLPLAAVPFGRIVNNSVWGGDVPTGTGILVTSNAGPTIINSIVANTATGISVDASSNANTVLGANLYSNNIANTNAGTSPGTNAIFLTPADPLFRDPANRNFYLAAGSKAIDSSLNTLADRPSIASVRSSVGIQPSNILAPDRDLFGQLRLDDPNQTPPPGLGSNIFKDRGAIERADFFPMTAQVIDPLDNDPNGRDRDANANDVKIKNELLEKFVIKFADVGVGVDDLTVKSANFTVTSTNLVGVTTTLVDGTDYTFVYNSTSDEVTLLPSSGIWPLNFTYSITVNNTPPGAVDGTGNPLPSGVLDLAGNPVAANRNDGRTLFTIFTGILRDYGDAPDPNYPTLQVHNGASHEVIPGFRLGAVETEESDGLQSANADGDTGDDGVSFPLPPSPVVQNTVIVNAAIPAGMTGVLDAWFDLNRDGDWDDTGEKVISGAPLVNGNNSILYTFGGPGTPKGTTFARFRLTTGGINSPVGVAANGEVEDYKITITGPPYQNQKKNTDVDNDGAVAPIDALLVINFLNAWSILVGPGKNIPLPPRQPEFPPPVPGLDPSGGGVPGRGRYIDVDGNGFLTPLDALLVINELNSKTGGFGGEGEGEASFAANSLIAASATNAALSDSEGTSSLIPAVLFASQDIVIEERALDPLGSALSQVGQEQQVHDLAVKAILEPSALLTSRKPAGPGDEELLYSRLDEPSWESLLSDLADDEGRENREGRQAR